VLVPTTKEQPNNTQKHKTSNPMTNKLALVKKKYNNAHKKLKLSSQQLCHDDSTTIIFLVLVLVLLSLMLLSDHYYRRRPHPSQCGGWSSLCCEGWSSLPISADTSHAAHPSATAPCLTGSPTNDTVPVTSESVVS